MGGGSGDKFAKLAVTRPGRTSSAISMSAARKYDVTVDADGFIIGRTDPKFSHRMTYCMEADGNRIVSKGEMSHDRGAWEADLSTKYERV